MPAPIEKEFILKKEVFPLPNQLLDALFDLDQNYFPIPWSLEAWKSIKAEHYALFVMYQEDAGIEGAKLTVIGFSLFQTLPGDPQAHLLKIFMIPSQRGRALAHEMHSFCVEELKRLGVKEIFLEVEASNLSAINFYKKHNYQVVHKVHDYYGNDGDGLMMLCVV